MILESQILALGQGLEILPFLGATVGGAIAGLILGLKNRSWLSMWLVCAGFAGVGFWLMGPHGLLSGFLTPLLYYYGRFS